ncbi:hypothetical protein JL722_737 [Aureococcus anophagefferens]|nr:hypothetical protein JL722_737 [Aureococcus anophagefferens]
MPGDARPAAPCHVGERPAIVLLGDSLTQYGFGPEGWASRLAHRYQRRADVLNRGYSGYTSRWLLAAPSAAAVPHAKVLLTVIWLGANDAAPKSALEPRAADEFSENLAALAFSKKHPDASFRDVDRTRASAKRYAFIAKLAAQQGGAAFCDVFEAFDARPDGGRALLSDGLHLNEKGEALVFETLLRTVDDHCPRLRLSPCAETMSPANAGSFSQLRHHLPWHNVLDDRDYARQLCDPDHAAALPRDDYSAAPTPRTGAADLRRSGSGDGSFSEYGSSGDFGRDYNDSRDFSRDFSRDHPCGPRGAAAAPSPT